MSLSQLKREALQRAEAARSKAGPMDANGNVPRPEYLAEAERYYAEARRLTALIARGAQKREGAA
jgi:hypothetical protein